MGHVDPLGQNLNFFVSLRIAEIYDFLSFLFILKLSYSKPFQNTLNYVSLRHSLIARVSFIEKCACRAISSDFNTAHKKICVSSDIKMRFF